VVLNLIIDFKWEKGTLYVQGVRKRVVIEFVRAAERVIARVVGSF